MKRVKLHDREVLIIIIIIIIISDRDFFVYTIQFMLRAVGCIGVNWHFFRPLFLPAIDGAASAHCTHIVFVSVRFAPHFKRMCLWSVRISFNSFRTQQYSSETYCHRNTEWWRDAAVQRSCCWIHKLVNKSDFLPIYDFDAKLKIRFFFFLSKISFGLLSS